MTTTTVRRTSSTSGVTIPPRRVLEGPLTGKTVALCAGPGGTEQAARILGLPLDAIGVELDRDACDTGRAAGFDRRQHDIRELSPAKHRGVTGLIVTTPCPTFGDSGKRSGRDDMSRILDAVTCIGSGCGCDWRRLIADVQDPRSALVVEGLRWAIEAPDLEWLVCEQVPAVEDIWEDLYAELASHDWQWLQLARLDAAWFGLPVRRDRVFLLARRRRGSPRDLGQVQQLAARLPQHTMASVLGLPAGTRVWTRGASSSGGNSFKADGPSWCLTRSSRSWKIGGPDGWEMTAAQAGQLNGFPADFKWQGSRSKQFLQVADVVHPVVGAAVLATVHNIDWFEPVRRYLLDLYGPGQPRPVPRPRRAKPRIQQLTLMEVS